MAEINKDTVSSGEIRGIGASPDDVFAGLNTRLKKFKQAWAAEFTERLQKKYYPGHGYITGDLQRGWGVIYRATDLEFYNTKEYASYVEYGTIYMAPQGQLRATKLEHEQISEAAAKKVGLKK